LAEELKAVLRYDQTQVTHADYECRIQVVFHDGRHLGDEIAPLRAAVGARSLTVTDAHEPATGSGPAKDDLPGPGVSRVAEGAALALLGVDGDDLKINLLPKAVTEIRSLLRHLLLTTNVWIVVFLGVFVAAQLLTRSTHVLDRRIEASRLSGSLYTAPALFAKERFLDQEIARLRQRVDPLRNALDGRRAADWPEIFQAVRQAAPAEVSVAQLQCGDGKSLSLQGFTSSCPAAEAFVRDLESQPLFASVSLATIRRHPDGRRLEYRIDCILKAKGGPSS
jgi:Tfp pilus assembly protein PilN